MWELNFKKQQKTQIQHPTLFRNAVSHTNFSKLPILPMKLSPVPLLMMSGADRH